MVGKTCEKDRFWAESEKEKEGRNDDVDELPFIVAYNNERMNEREFI